MADVKTKAKTEVAKTTETVELTTSMPVKVETAADGAVLNGAEISSMLKRATLGKKDSPYFDPELGVEVHAVVVGYSTIKNKFNKDGKGPDTIKVVRMITDDSDGNEIITADVQILNYMNGKAIPCALGIVYKGKMNGDNGEFKSFDIHKLEF